MSGTSININATLLAPTLTRLVGRVVAGLTGPSGIAEVAKGDNYLGKSVLAKALTADDLHIAHIYGFTFAGRYVPLHVPALFVVRTGGQPVSDKPNRPVDPGRLGLGHIDSTVRFPADFRFWIYDSGDETLRLDFTIGTLQKLVIDPETGHGDSPNRVDILGAEGQFAARLGRGSY